MKIRNIFIIFLVSGFWHGANWTFIIWGFLNALYFLPLALSKNNRRFLNTVADGRAVPTFQEASQILITFGLTVLAWIFFRAESVGHAFSYIDGIVSGSVFSLPEFIRLRLAALTLILILIFVLIEWRGREDQFAIQRQLNGLGPTARCACYLALALSIMYLGNFSDNQFIYFQF